MLTIYGMLDSGNCYKPRLLAALLGVPFRHIEVSFLDGGTKAAWFRAKTPIGKVPLLELDDGRLLPESNAMLWYLGEGSRFIPDDPFDRARMLGWMFFEQYSHEPYVAVRRSLLIYVPLRGEAPAERLAETLERGNHALAVMDDALGRAPFLVGDAPSLADIALYAYSHVAEEGGFDLARFPHVSAWLARVAALPGYRPMTWRPDP